ncbi:hypothetical protein GCM10028807_58020 [Spirosoma daeguense]
MELRERIEREIVRIDKELETKKGQAMEVELRAQQRILKVMLKPVNARV